MRPTDAACAKENRPARDGARRLCGAAAVAAGLLAWSINAARALDCPIAQPATTASALQESRQTIQTLSDLMAAQGTDVVPEIITQLRRKYPTAQDAEITNYLITLYCPVVNQDAALSDAEKSARLGAFSSQVMQMLASR
jgi:hypothetical protein